MLNYSFNLQTAFLKSGGPTKMSSLSLLKYKNGNLWFSRWLLYVGDYFLSGSSDFFKCCHQREVAWQPEETPQKPHKTTNGRFYTCAFLQIKQTKCNMITSEHQRYW